MRMIVGSIKNIFNTTGFGNYTKKSTHIIENKLLINKGFGGKINH